MRIQVLSDIHLEFGPFTPPETDADVIVAAGDIHVHADGVEWLAGLGKPVIYIAGNHEFWGGDFEHAVEALRKACRARSIYFLENNQVTLGGVTFYGCTLWTDFAGGDPDILQQVRMGMNDFAYIATEGHLVEPEWLARYNQASLRWLKKALGRKTANKQVVVTHHAPSLKSWGFDPESPLRYAYCNELDEMIRARRMPLWIHGHVHHRSDYRILDTRVVCNPRGYHPGSLVDGFEPGKVVEV